MKYNAVITKKTNGEIYSAEIMTDDLGYAKIDPCCDKMAEAWTESFIGFGEYEGWGNKIATPCIYSCAPYPEGACWYEMSIYFCPFCGKKIEGIFEEKIKG